MTRALYAQFTAKPGREGRVAELTRELAVEVRREPGNIVFDAHQSASEPRSFFVYEVYRDDDAFAAHIGSEHGARFNAALADLIEEEASRLTWLRTL